MKLNLTCPINKLSYGLASVSLARALSAKAEVSLFLLGDYDPEDEAADRALRPLLSRPYSRDGHSLRVYHQFDLAHHVGKGTHASLTFFELDEFDEREKNHMEQQDVVFVPTQWAKGVLADAGVKANVAVAPIGVDVIRLPRPPKPPSGPGKYVGTTRFFTVGKWEIRKGHDVLIEAFNRAFEPSDDVSLATMCESPTHPGGRADLDRYNAEWARYYEGSKMGLAGKVKCLPRTPTRMGVARLIHESDVGVFVSRAEGWNMPLAETIACGVNVIATATSGHQEYVNDSNAFLVRPSGRTRAYDGTWFHGQKGWWDEVKVDDVADAMREMHRRKQEGALGANPGARDLLDKYSWARTANMILGEL